MKIIKRSGAEVPFDRSKIVVAVTKASNEAKETNRLSEKQIESIADDIEIECAKQQHALNVEEIQDLVENGIMECRAYDVAKIYITYRYKHELMRKSNTTDAQILSLLDENNEEVKQENSNKNPTVVSVQRDYMAGEVSKDVTRR
ncbi:MAG TPA: anaerobic ribonucleoside-triphosphate reductase, partial [Treponema sp.]|nr:anaerobic ribonucleoside-triphosphate reductase [Treponema sp.]